MVAVVLGGLVAAVPAAPAMAATPYCNVAIVHTNSAGQDLFMPGSDFNFSFTPDCIMAQGAFGNHVAQLQSTMNTCYGEHLTVDRDFGPLTKAALKRTQTKVHVQSDGVYGPQTRRAMVHRIVAGGGRCARST
jgi:hypothetical protein